MRKEYVKPSMAMVVLTCEAGYANSTGGLTFGGGTSDGWYDAY